VIQTKGNLNLEIMDFEVGQPAGHAWIYTIEVQSGLDCRFPSESHGSGVSQKLMMKCKFFVQKTLHCELAKETFFLYKGYSLRHFVITTVNRLIYLLPAITFHLPHPNSCRFCLHCPTGWPSLPCCLLSKTARQYSLHYSSCPDGRLKNHPV
jgi:hypothetical protein